MEDYETFVRNCLSHLRNKEEELKKPSSSAIRFYGAPILPPLLTDTQREEMQKHREAAQKDAVTRRLKGNGRLAYVQTILHSVQMMNSPTLEVLLQELKVAPKSLDSSNSSESSQRSINTVAEINSPLVSPLSSTSNSAFFSSHVTPQPSHKGGCLVEHHENQHPSQPSSFNSANPCSVSFGDVTHAIIENTTSLSGSLDIRSVSHCPQGTNNTTDFFLPKTSKTMAKMSDIISYPPIDGEELERSGQESSFSHDFLAKSDSSCSIFPEDSIRSDNFPEYQSENGQMDIAESQDNLPPCAVLSMKERPKIRHVVVPVPFLDSCSSSNILELPQTPSIDCFCADQLIQSNQGNTESMNTQGPQTQLKSPNRPSLQDLLRKSQEYRRQQRLLRNQAKNARIQERAQEQPRVEEKSLSDKENNEFHDKSTEGIKTKQKSFFKTMNTTCQKSDKNKPVFLDELVSKKANHDSERVSDQITLPYQQPLSQLQTQEVYHLTSDQTTTDPFTSVEGRGIFHSIPVPNFCQSPVYSKGSSSLPDGADNLRGTVLLSSSPNESHKADEKHNIGLQSDAPSAIVKSSQHINQLESCLSNLKELISDLGSSLVQLEGNWEDRPDEGNVVKQYQRNNEGTKGQSLESCRSMLGNTDDQNNSSKDHFLSILQDKGKEVKSEKLSLVNTFTVQGKINDKAFNMSSGQLDESRKQQPPPECVLSLSQWMPIPDVFRNVLSEPTVPHDVPVLLDSSSHNTEKNNELAEDGHNSTNMLSVNQSFNVDMPSEVQLLEGSGSEQDSSNQLVQGKGLTPVSVAGIESMSSKKVKRRLLMHVTDNYPDRTSAPCSEDLAALIPSYSTSRGSDSLVEELKQVHAAQVRALQEQHRKQQEELCQALTVRYCLLQSSSFPCSLSGSHLGDTVTFSKLPQETQQFMQALQLPSPRGEICSQNDRIFLQQVSRQLRASRYEIYDIFFCLSVAERMQLISLDREQARKRVLRRQMGHTNCPKGKSFLSAGTQKSLQTKRGILIQKKVSERRTGVVTTKHKTGFTSEQPLATKRGQSRTKPAAISQRWYSSRPR
ncbi:uncharacterized protein cp110 isoform X2 [Phyllopteryx taeniolatus]|uniref:uncharacterized protein cp110 isoform X2 n=1 Tax=Phyllopteryx taeniolatus TaxID=161469 RepID=UPI002AD4D7B6|nr:uncharacterized protein cp110 isoform X2 [Phyllopteryx taeniolatus]